MKTYILNLMLFIPLFVLAQDKNISVVSIEKANIVYYGISNNIKIAVPKAKSFEVTAPGKLTKLNNLGNYSWHLTGVQCCEATLEIKAIMENGDTLREQKTYQLKGVGSSFGTIDGKYCNDNSCKLTLTKEEIKSGKIGFEFENYGYDVTGLEWYFGGVFDGKVNKFVMIIVNKDTVEKQVSVTGDVMNQAANNEIDMLKQGDEIFITNISANGFDKEPAPIWIEITD